MSRALRTPFVALIVPLVAACAAQATPTAATPAVSDVSAAIEPPTSQPLVPEAEPAAAESESFETAAGDGVRIYAEMYAGGLDRSAPLILAFHQGGSNGRGEYGPLVPWLNENGYRVIAWDQRAGGETHGESNRTLAGLQEGTAAEYCDAYPDLEAALKYVLDHDLGDDVIVWGSSYSAALVFKLAARNPEHVAGVIAFSPASGGPLAACRARDSVDAVRASMMVFRPASEMESESVREQQAVLTAAGASFQIVDQGVHGSSMLVDERTGDDMSDARATVIAWLKSLN